ncbi:MAG: Fic family protein [Parachlamydiaceae bacterium]|nr:Fic family protein [Parachlamydiaceae bacterium]
MYIYDQSDWPKFKWDTDKISTILCPLLHDQGRLLGQMERVGFKLQQGTFLETLTQDVIKSSEIEGELLDQTQVRSSVAKHLGIDIGALLPSDRNVDGIVEMILDATQNYDQSLTKERLFYWHTKLFPIDKYTKIKVGEWRQNVMQVVSGKMGQEVVHYEAPKAGLLDKEMALFLKWVNEDSNLDPVLKAAIAHLWFITIHPFDDGNGRIARAISDMLLARAEKSSLRFYSLSAQIQSERKDYYKILEKTQKGDLDITAWIEWFLGCLGSAIEKARISLSNIFFKVKFWEKYQHVSLNERQKKVINKLLDGFDNKLTTTKWSKMAKCSQDTAHRDIIDLIEKDILSKNTEGGRSTSYSLIQIDRANA